MSLGCLGKQTIDVLCVSRTGNLRYKADLGQQNNEQLIWTPYDLLLLSAGKKKQKPLPLDYLKSENTREARH